MSFGVTAEQLRVLNLALKDERLEKFEEFGGIDSLVKALRTDLKSGLRNELDDSRTQAFGSNSYPETKLKSIFFYIGEALKDKTLIILIVCAVVSLIFGIFFSSEKNGWIDSMGIFLAIFLVVSVSSFNNWTKEKQFRDLNRIKEDREVKVLRTGDIHTISTRLVQVGDIVQLDTGDQVPADGILFEGFNVECDQSNLTGEPEGIPKNPQTSALMMSGTQLVDGVGTMIVTAVGLNTEWGEALKKIVDQEPEDTPLQGQLEKLADAIGYFGGAVAGIMFIVLTIKFLVVTGTSENPSWGWETFGSILKFLVLAVSLIVAAVPEGLPLAVTISLAFSVKKMLKDNNLVRNLSACETMGSATTICSDKTGTLTTNRMTVIEAWIGGETYEKVEEKPNNLQLDVYDILCDGIAINSKANVNVNTDSGVPEYIGNKTECAMLLMLHKFGVNYKTIRKGAAPGIAQIFTFSSDRKRMSTVVKFEQQHHYRVFTKGASEIVLDLCTQFMDVDGNVFDIDHETRQSISDDIERMASKGLRTICIAFNDFVQEDEQNITPELVEKDLICVAIVGIKDPLREEVTDSIVRCKGAGIMVRMVTGDNISTAKHIASECGIFDPSVGGIAMEGPEFRSLMRPGKSTDDPMSGPEFRARMTPRMLEILPHLQVLARSSPTDKHLLVSCLKELGDVVSVTGDGTNDAPALKAANVGLSMGVSGTEVAKEASDIVIMDDNFASIVKSVLWGRSVYENVRKFLQFQITINVAAVLVTFIGSVSGQGFPLTAVQLLWINLIMDTFAALALATEPPTDDLLHQKPHGTEDYLITNNMWKNIIVQAALQLAILLPLIYAHEQFFGPISATNSLSKRIDHEDFTLVFNVFVWCQLFNMWNARKINNELNIFQNLAQSWIFLVILVVCVAMQAIIVELGGYFGFGTHGLSWVEWLVSIGLGALALPLGFILRFIPMPKKGLCGYEIDIGQLFKKLRRVPASSSVGKVEEMDDIMAGPTAREEQQQVQVELDDFMSKK